MKKIISILIFSLVISIQGIFSQINTNYDNSLDYSQSYFYIFDQDDVFSAGDSVWTHSIFKKSHNFLKPSLYLELDSTGGTFDTTKIYIESKEWDEQTYELQDSVTWYLGSDTTCEIKITTGVQDAIWRTRVWCESDEFRLNIDVYKIRFWE